MIVTVTLNPSLDYIQFLSEFKSGRLNRCHRELIRPGGKGINVSLMLSVLGIENRATGFAAGFTGRALEDMLKQRNVCCDFVKVSGITRVNVKVMADTETEINGCGPKISASEFNLLLDKLNNLTKEDYLVLSGSVAAGMLDNTYEKVMEAVSAKGVRVVVDASGDALKKTLKYKPFLIKPNHHELSEIVGINIDSVEDARKAANELILMGAQNVICSMGSAGALLVQNSGDVIYIKPPEGKLINSVAAGDSMIAGFLAEYTRSKDINAAFKFSVAAGSATAYSEWLADFELINKLHQELLK